MKRVAFVSPTGRTAAPAAGKGWMRCSPRRRSAKTWGVFVGDGVLQLLPGQQPEKILARNYIATFGVLPLYDVERCYLCQASLQERGLSQVADWVLDAEVLAPDELRRELAGYDAVMTF